MDRCSKPHGVVGSLALVFVLFDCLRVLSPAFQRRSSACYCTTTLTEIQAGEASALCALLTCALWIDLPRTFVIFTFCRLLAPILHATQQSDTIIPCTDGKRRNFGSSLQPGFVGSCVIQ